MEHRKQFVDEDICLLYESWRGVPASILVSMLCQGYTENNSAHVLQIELKSIYRHCPPDVSMWHYLKVLNFEDHYLLLGVGVQVA